MKKQYISPCSQVYNIRISSIMAGSLDPNKAGDQKVIPDSSEPAPDEFTSRGNMWDDDDF